MGRYFALVVLTSLGFASLATSEPPPAQPSATVEQLIQQLSSKDFHTRDLASKAITALGVDALSALQKGRTNPDPEVRRRLDELIPPLERSLTLMPKRVTLHMTNRPLSEVLAEISKQTGYKLATWEGQTNPAGPKAVYTFHFDKAPFWEALDRVCEGAGLVLQQNWGDEQLRLMFSDSYIPYVSCNGPFKVVATGFSYYRNNNFGQLPRNPAQQGQQAAENLQLSFMIWVEPKLPIIKVGMARLLSAEDEEKHSMLPVPINNGNMWWGSHYYGGGYRTFFHQTQCHLAWASKTCRTVKTLKGVIPVTLLADQKPTVITDKILSAKGKKFKVGDASFSVEEVTSMPGNNYQIRMAVTEEAKDNPNDYSRMQSMQQRLELQDEKGNKYPSYVNFTNWNPSSAQLTLMTQPAGIAKLGKPAKLVFYSWSLMEHEVTFEFKDLPLP
jgi:hypothetical protein